VRLSNVLNFMTSLEETIPQCTHTIAIEVQAGSAPADMPAGLVRVSGLRFVTGECNEFLPAGLDHVSCVTCNLVWMNFLRLLLLEALADLSLLLV
jgi:hypothetical protein